MPQSAAQTTTTLTALGSQAISATDAQVVTVELRFQGVTMSPNAIRAALDAAYGTVSLETDGAERPNGPFRFLIQP